MRKLLLLSICLFSVCLNGQNIYLKEKNKYISDSITSEHVQVQTYKDYVLYFSLVIKKDSTRKLKYFKCYGEATDYVSSGFIKNRKNYDGSWIRDGHYGKRLLNKSVAINQTILVESNEQILKYKILAPDLYTYEKHQQFDLFGLIVLNNKPNSRVVCNDIPTKIILDSIVLFYDNNTISVLKKYKDTNYYVNNENYNRILNYKEKQTPTSFSEIVIAVVIILCVIGLLFLYTNELDKRQIENENQEKARIDNLKNLYKSTSEPIKLGKTFLRCSQKQTKQLMTGALMYAQPKEYSLHVTCTNISDKIITAVEFEINTLNAFNEIISSFVLSTRKNIHSLNTSECSWDLNGSFDINNAITKVKRVMFSDGTTWNNK